MTAHVKGLQKRQDDGEFEGADDDVQPEGDPPRIGPDAHTR